MFIALNANECDCYGRVVIVLEQLLYFLNHYVLRYTLTSYSTQQYCLEDMLHCFLYTLLELLPLAGIYHSNLLD